MRRGGPEWQRLNELEKEHARLTRMYADLDTPVITALQAVIAQHGRSGFRQCRDRLRALGHPWNHKRVNRVCRALGLNHVRRIRKRRPTRDVVPLQAPAQFNDTWAMDFMGDTL